MHFLLIEDEKPKAEQIVMHLRSLFSDASIDIAKSVRSAIDALSTKSPDIILLDMSLPTFDIGEGETGGRPRGFGGLEVLNEMEVEELIYPVIVVTGYEAFLKDGKDMNLGDLRTKLVTEHPRIFRGLIHYNSLFGEWQESLSGYIKEIIEVRK